jgi:CheY-like chemotaxis protein/HPt (histidine-containing phosphotransfer) domain-containing protein
MCPLVGSNARRLKLMVVDDDDLSLSLASLLLKSDGYEILEAKGGTAAVDFLTSLQPDALPSVLLVDLRMPGLSGQALASTLRSLAPNARLLAMSATPDRAEGYDAFVKKPLDLASLRTALEGRVEAEAESLNGRQPVLDEGVFQRMAGMMPPAAVREVYEACLSDVRDRSPEIRTAGAANDLPSVRRTAHTFKGSAGMIGARKLASAAAELELGAYKPDDVPKLVDNLLSCCDELHRILMSKL